jgi:hypothetical protein
LDGLYGASADHDRAARSRSVLPGPGALSSARAISFREPRRRPSSKGGGEATG